MTKQESMTDLNRAILNILRDGEWRTVAEIAHRLGQYHGTVSGSMSNMRAFRGRHWIVSEDPNKRFCNTRFCITPKGFGAAGFEMHKIDTAILKYLFHQTGGSANYGMIVGNVGSAQAQHIYRLRNLGFISELGTNINHGFRRVWRLTSQGFEYVINHNLPGVVVIQQSIPTPCRFDSIGFTNKVLAEVDRIKKLPFDSVFRNDLLKQIMQDEIVLSFVYPVPGNNDPLVPVAVFPTVRQATRWTEKLDSQRPTIIITLTEAGKVDVRLAQ